MCMCSFSTNQILRLHDSRISLHIFKLNILIQSLFLDFSSVTNSLKSIQNYFLYSLFVTGIRPLKNKAVWPISRRIRLFCQYCSGRLNSILEVCKSIMPAEKFFLHFPVGRLMQIVTEV